MLLVQSRAGVEMTVSISSDLTIVNKREVVVSLPMDAPDVTVNGFAIEPGTEFVIRSLDRLHISVGDMQIWGAVCPNTIRGNMHFDLYEASFAFYSSMFDFPLPNIDLGELGSVYINKHQNIPVVLEHPEDSKERETTLDLLELIFAIINNKSIVNLDSFLAAINAASVIGEQMTKVWYRFRWYRFSDWCNDVEWNLNPKRSYNETLNNLSLDWEDMKYYPLQEWWSSGLSPAEAAGMIVKEELKI